jgi:dTDP-glucose 4,6-dehydratase
MKKIMGARVAVLGGAGFLGSHLCERLLADGAAEVISVDNLATGRAKNLTALRGRGHLRVLHHDITTPIPIRQPCDFVFNLASPASPIDYGRLPIETLRVGALGTEHGVKLALAGSGTFIQASTSEIYGDPLVHPQSEDYAGNVDCTGPRAVYDEAKRYGEAIVSAYRRSLGADTRIARIFNTYGPRMRLDDGRVVPAFIGQALRGEDFTVFGDGSQTRSFCYVRDLIDGLVRLALSQVTEPVNLGNPKEMTILQFAEAVRAAFGSGGKIIQRPLPQGDPRQRRPDISRARQVLGWEPKVSLEDGLRETIGWFRQVGAREPVVAQA